MPRGGPPGPPLQAHGERSFGKGRGGGLPGGGAKPNPPLPYAKGSPTGWAGSWAQVGPGKAAWGLHSCTLLPRQLTDITLTLPLTAGQRTKALPSSTPPWSGPPWG
jgi:hypothetical protein